MRSFQTLTTAAILILGLLLATPAESAANTKAKKKGPLTRAELKQAERRLAEMGYWTGPLDGVIDSVTRTALTAFQKWEGRRVTGLLTRAEFNAISDAAAPEPRDSGYKHVEVDLDRQVLLLTDDEGAVTKILPVSTGSGKQYREPRMSGLAYT